MQADQLRIHRGNLQTLRRHRANVQAERARQTAQALVLAISATSAASSSSNASSRRPPKVGQKLVQVLVGELVHRLVPVEDLASDGHRLEGAVGGHHLLGAEAETTVGLIG